MITGYCLNQTDLADLCAARPIEEAMALLTKLAHWCARGIRTRYGSPVVNTRALADARATTAGVNS
jgi:hypothetical protein